MAKDARQFDGGRKVQLLTLPEIQIAVGDMQVAVTDAAGTDPQKHLRALGRWRRFDHFAQGGPELGELITPHPARARHDPRPQARAALSRAFSAWIASRAAFHWSSSQR